VSTGCPGDLLTGLVDGELDHATRERVLSHLLSCTACHHEVEGLRALKGRLAWAGAETPVPSAELTARLLHFAVPGVEPVARTRPRPARAVRVGPSGRAPAAPRPHTPRRLRRRTVGTIVALGLSAAFVLGGSTSPSGAQAPIDPTTDQFVTDYVDATVEVPLTQPVEATVTRSGR
jgi:anti-sigma factor RsiW